MFRTYELYFCHPDGRREFVALTCLDAELLNRASEALRESEAHNVEIFEAGELLLNLQRETPGGA